MITRLEIRNFKSFRNVALDLGRLNLFVGANASGKSNFFDALRVLQGIGNGFTVSEILDGKPKSASSEVWEGIRGGSAKVCFEGPAKEDRFTIMVDGSLAPILAGHGLTDWRYSVTLAPALGWVASESLEYGGKTLYRTDPSKRSGGPIHTVTLATGNPGRPPNRKLERSRPVLPQFAKLRDRNLLRTADAAKIAAELADMQRMDPAPSVLRSYSQAHRIERMGERGENFAALVKTLSEDPATKSAFLDWLRELRPEELDDVATLSGAVGEPLFMLREAGREFPAPVLSDGTLRFAALVAAFFQPDMPRIMTIEEIENGVHASRARALVELLRGRAADEKTQILATTHSPTVLAWLDPEEYATTYFFRRDPDTGEASATPLSEIRNFREVIEKHPIGDLFAEGWMEAAS